MQATTHATTTAPSSINCGIPRIPAELWAIYLSRENMFVMPADQDAEDAIMTWPSAAAAEEGLRSQIANDYVSGDSRPVIVRVK